MQTPHFESSLYVLLKVSGHFWVDPLYMFESNGCFFGDIYAYTKPFFFLGSSFRRYWILLWLVKSISRCGWSRDNFLFLWISVKRHLVLIYHSEALWSCPATKPNWLFLCMYIHIYKVKLALTLSLNIGLPRIL